MGKEKDKDNIWAALSAAGIKQEEDKRKFQSHTIEINLEYVDRNKISKLFTYLRYHGWFENNDVRYVMKQTQIPLSFDDRSAEKILRGDKQ